MPQVSALNQHTQKVAGMLDFTSKSTCYSPFSLMHALSLLTKCSNDDSIQELVQKLELNEAQIQDFVAQLKKDASVAVASNIFDANILGVNEDFKKLMLKQYDVVPEQLVSAAQVNGWCAKHTNNKVKEIMDDILGAETILISAIHFKAAWDFKFNPYMTHKRSFTGFSRESEVDMMQITFKVDYVQTKTAQVVRLPYSDSSLSAYIILPLSKSESDFKVALSLINLQPSFKKSKTVLYLPRFTINSTFNLVPLLQQFGVQKIFNNIDCSQTLGKTLSIQQIIQKTFVETNEKGTEAASVTVIEPVKGPSFSFVQTKVVMCDRPFWFVLSGAGGAVFVSSVVE
ncbi:Serpin_1 [Hexamita inflata]|uniref:Serpin 1 n=1 Tax=Hexamita inflata TaxID=28002 RepID=A0AA86Q9R8_9EUKA|nr:Serpin 1 [Hexamita inflata]